MQRVAQSTRASLRAAVTRTISSRGSRPLSAIALCRQPLFKGLAPNSCQRVGGGFTQLSSRWLSTGKKTVPFILSDIGEGIAEVELMQWFVAEGDPIRQFDNICEVQSDKATVEISSRFDGVVTKVHFKVGDMIDTGAALVDIEVDDNDAAGAEAASSEAAPASLVDAPAAAAADASAAAAAATAGRNAQVLTTPAVRKIARENGLDLALVPASGPQGRILKSDVLDYLSGKSPAVGHAASTPGTSPLQPATAAVALEAPAAAAAAAAAAVAPKAPLPTRGGANVAGESSTVPITGLARGMVKSMNASLKIPHFTFSEEVCVDALHATKGSLNVSAAPYGLKLSYLPLILKALSMSLHEYPVLNASVSSDEKSVTYHGDHNIGLAMDTPRGLLVPCIKQVQNKSVFEIAEALAELQALGAAGKLGEEQLTGATISVSNMGSIGGLNLAPVITSPQVAIVALGRIQTLPRYGSNGEVVPTKIMPASWAGDHRIVDGATIARFVNTWKGYLENPSNMLAHLK